MTGASMVLPGSHLDSAHIYRALREEQATAAIGVPTVWLALQQYVAEHALAPRQELVLNRVLCGGAAAPRAVIDTFERDYNVDVIHAWGMTETSPFATLGHPLHKHVDYSAEQQLDVQAKQGRVPYGVDIKHVNDDGGELPRDGTTSGRLMVRGHWVTSAYFRGEGGAIVDDASWFDTGDIATIDSDGYMQLTDRAKDLVKSGGEWSSSIGLENAAVGHTSVAEAAVIAMKHPTWQERPLMIVVRKHGANVSKQELPSYLAGKVAKWWLPDDIIFVEEIPHTTTGKIQKTTLRALCRLRRECVSLIDDAIHRAPTHGRSTKRQCGADSSDQEHRTERWGRSRAHAQSQQVPRRGRIPGRLAVHRLHGDLEYAAVAGRRESPLAIQRVGAGRWQPRH